MSLYVIFRLLRSRGWREIQRRVLRLAVEVGVGEVV
jgi:hypothetical protein